MPLIRRWKSNPILSPNPGLSWATYEARNPGVVWDGQAMRMVYTTCADPHQGGKLLLGYAESKDGFAFEPTSRPFMQAPDDPSAFDHGGLEDVRITPIGDTFYIAYAGRAFTSGDYWGKKHPGWSPAVNPTWGQNFRRVGLAKTRNWKDVERLGPITSEQMSDANVVLFPEKINGRYAMLHRPTPFHPGQFQCLYTPANMWIAFSNSLTDWGWDDDRAHQRWPSRSPLLPDDYLLAKPEQDWERLKVGGSGVPIQTDEGWLIFYHAVDLAGVYRIGLMMLDRDDPRIVIARTCEPVMEPEDQIEMSGHYCHGPGCVFPCANVVIDDDVFIYYGASDKHCCLAMASLSHLIEHVMMPSNRRAESLACAGKLDPV